MEKRNIEVIYDSDDFVEFRTTCQCCSDDHELTVIVEVEDWNKKDKNSPSRPMVLLCFKCGRFEDPVHDNFFKRLWKRIKDACKILFTGYLDLEGDFIFRDDETNHLRDFRSALGEAITQVEKCRRQNKES